MAAPDELAEELDDPALAVDLRGEEAHPQEVELEVGPAPDDLQVVVEDRIRIGMTDDHPARVGALLLEHRQLGQPDRGQHAVGRDRHPGSAGDPGGGADGHVPPGP